MYLILVSAPLNVVMNKLEEWAVKAKTFIVFEEGESYTAIYPLSLDDAVLLSTSFAYKSHKPAKIFKFILQVSYDESNDDIAIEPVAEAK